MDDDWSYPHFACKGNLHVLAKNQILSLVKVDIQKIIPDQFPPKWFNQEYRNRASHSLLWLLNGDLGVFI